MLSSEFIDQLDPSYRALLLEALPGLSEKTPDSIKFIERYMVPKQLLKNFYHYYWQKYQFLGCLSPNKLLNEQIFGISNAVYLLSFPNLFLDKAFKKLQKEADSPLSNDVYISYQKIKTHYDKIKEAENDEEKWIEALIAVGDDEFVEHNVEYRLGEDLTNKNLWKLYLQFWKNRDTKKLLHTYSKYCRFFLDDLEMKEEYQKTAEKYGPIEVPWTNPFKFEKYYKDIVHTVMRQNQFKKTLIPIEKSSSQIFAFKNSFINYILMNSNSGVRQKLFFFCKYFFQKLPTPICYKLTLDYNLNYAYRKKFVKESLELQCYSKKDMQQKNLYISNVLIVKNQHKMILKFFIPKLHRCDAKYLDISSQKFSYNDLVFLIGHGKVEYLHLQSVTIRDKSRKIVPVENIMKLTPMIKDIDIYEPVITSQTAEILSKLPFQNKFHSFYFWHIFNELEPYAFAEYIARNALSSSNIRITTKNSFTQSKNFQMIIREKIKNYWTTFQTPHFSFN